MDIKEDFFSIPLSKLSQPIFIFEWADLNWRYQTTNLDQTASVFKNSPTIFDETLNQYLSLFYSKRLEVTLLQSEEDILLAAKDKNNLRATRGLL